ncbi:glycosyltransferase family 4 protein [Streptomyces sp. NPDC006510]|uniref:glycosyltransferase family 4 protein n=1 Tax=Streptomyces sp. NPDC006510 TaxID=3155600 RepID=UPI0033A3B79D
MRICLVSTTYRPRTGGMETHVTNLAEQLAGLGHQVTVLTNRDHHSQPPTATEHGVDVIRASALLNAFTEHGVPWEEAMFGLLSDVAPLLADRPFDVVHTHTQASLLLACLSGLAARSRSLVASFHETRPETEPCGAERSRFIAHACQPDLVLAGSRRFADQALSFGYPEGRIRTVLMGTPATPVPEPRRRAGARTELEQRSGVPADGTLVVCVSRYTPRKAQHRLLDALPHLAGAGAGLVRVLLIGSRNGSDPGCLDLLQQRAAEAGDAVTMLHDCPDPLRDLAFRAGDILTQPSTHEGLGLAVVEGMHHGLPVVATDTHGLREVVTEQTGILTDTADPGTYAAALARLAADPHLRARLGQNGQRRAAEHFGIHRCAQHTLDVYREAISLRTAGAS